MWLLLLGLGLALIVLIVRHDDGTIAGLDSHQFASLTFYAALLVFFGSFVVAMFRHRFREALEAALFWVVIALFLAAGYSYRAELGEIGNRMPPRPPGCRSSCSPIRSPSTPRTAARTPPPSPSTASPSGRSSSAGCRR
jgi:hypothetical protein